MQPWWERYPDVLAQEKEALERAGHKAEFVVSSEAAMETAFEIDVGGERRPAVARFPAEYPYFKPEVYCPDLPLIRHYHPFACNLCLLPAATHYWSVDTTLADLLDEQLPATLEIGVDPQGPIADGRETRQGEPFSEYYSHMTGSAAFLGRTDIPTSVRFGQFKYVLLSRFPPGLVILEISDQHGNVVFEAEEWLADWAKGKTLTGKWRRVDEPFGFDDPKAAFDRQGPFPKIPPSRANKRPPELRALVFPEESYWRQTRDGFLFAINAFFPKDRKTSGKSAGGRGYGFVRTQPADSKDLLQRVPELRPLRDKHVIMVGLGMIGSHSALHLARSMVGRLTLVDFDFVEAGSIVRWALGMPTSGIPKSEALADHIRKHYPFVKVVPVNYKLGGVPVDEEGRKRFMRALEDADLVFDAAGEFGVSNFLSDQTRERGLPHVFATATPGGWGGQVGRAVPGRGGCWSCFKHHQNDGRIPVPNAGEGEVQPRGCANPTVYGSGFDMDQVAAAAVRLAVSTMCADADGGYPDSGYDCLVVNFRDETGKVVAPDWRPFEIPPHSDCPHGQGNDSVGSQSGGETA